MKSIHSLFIALFLVFVSCKKDKVEGNTWPKTELPNFGNIPMDKVFSQQDSQLENINNIQNQLNTYYTTIWEQGNLWGGILVAKGDKILLENYRGYAQPNNQSPITAETPLHIASISKPITAMAILKLIEAKKISLDSPVTQFFPKFPYPKVTIKTLLSHRSGLPRYEHFIEKLPKNAIELGLPYLTNQHILNLMVKYQPALARETDTGFMYCNTNYALLALIIEKITKKPFPKAMQEMIFQPLGMKNTFIFQEKDLGTSARSFYQKEDKLYPYDRLDLIYGDKNVYTTPRDLYQFSKAMFSQDFLPSLKEYIFTPYSNEKAGINNYGLGFRMKIFDNGEKLTYHNGWWHGSNSVFVHLPKSKTTIVAIGNKFSRRVYSAMSLSGLFENFPLELEMLNKTLISPEHTNPEAE